MDEDVKAPTAPTAPAAPATPALPMRIAKFLSRAGQCSRRQGEALIAQGRVSVDGCVIDSPATKIEAGQIMCLDGKRVVMDDVVRLWRYHKKRGFLTTRIDPKGRATIFDDLPPEMATLISVGRLDMNSEGLLLLTNDGTLARRLELPSSAFVRRYRVRVHGRVDGERLASLRRGVVFQGVRYGPVEAEQTGKASGTNSWIEMRFAEGKKREARRVLESIGLSVNRLIRIGFGPFTLDDLPPGAVEEADPNLIER